jgi:hypothetical protein
MTKCQQLKDEKKKRKEIEKLKNLLQNRLGIPDIRKVQLHDSNFGIP